MSHNSFKLGTAEPNALGAVSAKVDELTNVSISGLANNNFLQYNSSTNTWVNAPYVAPASTAPMILIGRGESNDYVNTGVSFALNQNVGFYDSAPINTISGATLNKAGATNWVMSVTLPAGKYVLMAQTSPVFSSTGNCGLRWRSSSVIYSSLAVVGANLTNYAGAASTLLGQATLAASTTVFVRVEVAAGIAASQGNTPAENGVLYIRKVN